MRPGTHRLRRSSTVPRPLPEVFAFFSEAANLERITPPWLRFTVATPSPVVIREGTLIDYRLRLAGVPLRWRSRIETWEPPHRFRDIQVRGPYRFWEHTHTFAETAGGTAIRDAVDFGLPLYPLGEAALPLVGFQLGKIFDYREAAVRRIFDPGARA